MNKSIQQIQWVWGEINVKLKLELRPDLSESFLVLRYLMVFSIHLIILLD